MVSNHVGARDSGIRQNEQQVIRKIAHGKCNSSPHPFFVALARWALREARGSGREDGDESSLETVRDGFALDISLSKYVYSFQATMCAT